MFKFKLPRPELIEWQALDGEEWKDVLGLKTTTLRDFTFYSMGAMEPMKGWNGSIAEEIDKCMTAKFMRDIEAAARKHDIEKAVCKSYKEVAASDSYKELEARKLALALYERGGIKITVNTKKTLDERPAKERNEGVLGAVEEYQDCRNGRLADLLDSARNGDLGESIPNPENANEPYYKFKKLVEFVRTNGWELPPQLVSLLPEQQGQAASDRVGTTSNPVPTNNWKLKIQAEATQKWKALVNCGCSPTRHSIKDDLATWCRDNKVTTDGGIFPKPDYIYKHVLRKAIWQSPTD